MCGLHKAHGPTAKIEDMNIEIPEDVARRLVEIAAAQHKTVEQIAVERLRSFGIAHSSPAHLLAVIRGLPRPSAGAVDDLEAAIASNRLPVRDQGMFDR